MYNSEYKCRLCGAIFWDGGTSSRQLAVKVTTALVCDVPCKMENKPQMLTVHACPGGSVGVADFQGYRRMHDA